MVLQVDTTVQNDAVHNYEDIDYTKLQRDQVSNIRVCSYFIMLFRWLVKTCTPVSLQNKFKPMFPHQLVPL